MNIYFSKQAQVLLENMDNFEIEKFKEWYIEKCEQAGSRDILEFLIEQDGK